MFHVSHTHAHLVMSRFMFYVFMIIAHACYVRDVNVCGSSVYEPLHIGQVGRVAQPNYEGRATHGRGFAELPP